jgi:hypothetical protein
MGLAACGSGPDPCANGACDVQGRTFVKWRFNAYPERKFNMDSCVDVGATKVAVDLVDATGTTISLQDDCGNAQVAFFGLPDGDYTVFVMPLDGTGAGLLSAPVQSMVKAGAVGVDREVTVDVPATAWLATYTGTFLFKISWGGLSCDAVTPDPIKDQEVALTINGVLQTVTTDDGQTLNGMDKKPCKKFTDEFPQSALNVPFGLATLEVKGYDQTNNMRFTKTFETFVGAGISNPTLTFDVPLQ